MTIPSITSLPSLPAESLITQTIDGHPAVSSKDVALHFQKKHKHILAEVDRLRSMLPPDEHGPNFRPMFESVAIGQNAIRQDRAYLMTEEGFSLVAMGFTGKAAVLWKWQYIKAFKALKEVVLSQRVAAATQDVAQTALAMYPAERVRLKKVLAYRKRGFSVGEIAAVMKLHSRRVGHLISTARKLGLLEEVRHAVSQ